MSSCLLGLPEELIVACIKALPYRWPDEAAVRCTSKALCAAALKLDPPEPGDAWVGATVPLLPSTNRACTSVLIRELQSLRRRSQEELADFIEAEGYDDIGEELSAEEMEMLRFMRTDRIPWSLNHAPLPVPKVTSRVAVCFRDAMSWIEGWIDKPTINRFEPVNFAKHGTFSFAGSTFAVSLLAHSLQDQSRPILECRILPELMMVPEHDLSTASQLEEAPFFEDLKGRLRVNPAMPHTIRYRCCFLGPASTAYACSEGTHPQRTQYGGSTVTTNHGAYPMETLCRSATEALLHEMRVAGTTHLHVEIVLEHIAYAAILH